MNDRFTRGLIAGLIGSIPSLLYNISAFLLHFSNLRFLDFSSVLIFGDIPDTFLETVFALLAVLVFMSILGAVFAFLIKGISSANLLLKGWLYANTLWFTFYGVTVLFKIPQLENTNLSTAFSNVIGSSIWGLTLAYALGRLDKKALNKI